MNIPEKGPLPLKPVRTPVAEKRPPGSIVSSPSAGHASVERRDDVRLTTKGLACHAAMRHAREMPDVRHDRVMQLRRRLAEGAYRINGERIAMNMMDESEENNSILNHLETDG